MDIFELDILKEISTTAAGYGSTALFQLLGKKISLNLPTVNSLEARDFVEMTKHEEGRKMIGVQCDIVTGLEGRVLLTLDEESAAKLVNVCYPNQKEIEEKGLDGELSVSVLKEVGDIVMSSYVKALSLFLSATINSSIPKVVRGSMDEIVETAVSSEEKMFVVIIDTVFEEKKEKIKGRMGFVLTQADKEMIQGTCKKKLDSLGE